MKVRSKLNIPQANKIFTDREEPREVFWEKYKQFKDNMLADSGDISVLSFYGIGGIGKSSLIDQIIKEMDDKLEKPLYVDFDFSTRQDCIGVLTSIRNILVDKYHFKFSLFDLARYNYFRKVGEDISAPQIKSLVSQSELLDTVFSIAGNIPVADIVANLLKTADQGITFIRNLITNHKNDLHGIEKKSAVELYNHLQVLFAKDLSDNLKGKQEPLVIFLDTYERLVNEMVSVGEPLINDEWIRGKYGLIQNTSNVFWVIAGREKLKWERFDSEWKDALEQHMLGSLSEADSMQFLETAGISEEKLRRELYILTNGTPIYLDLCVDNYNSLINEGISPTKNDFGENVYELVERFTRYMSQETKDLVYFLASLDIWNDEMLIDIASEAYPAFSISRYETIKNHSIISSKNDNLFTIHQTVGEVLVQNCPELFYRKVVTAAADYCKKLGMPNGKNINNNNFYLERYVFYSLKITEDDCLMSFFESNLSSLFMILCEYGQFDSAKSILEPFIARVKDKASSNYASILIWRALLAYYSGDYLEAKKLTEESCGMFEQLFGKKSDQYINSLNLLASVLEALGQSDKALEVQNEVLSYQKEVLGENHPETLVSMRNYAECLISLGREKEAFSILMQLLEKKHELHADDHPDTIPIMNDVAVCLSSLGREEDALKWYELVLSGLMKQNEIPPDKIMEIPEGLKKTGIQKEDIPSLIKAINPDVIAVQNNIATCLGDLGRHEEALKLYEVVLDKLEFFLGVSHPNTISTMRETAKCLETLGRYEDALELYKKILFGQKESLGDNHPKTIRAMEYVVKCLRKLKKYEEALELQKKVLTKRKELFGDINPDTIVAMDVVAECLKCLGRNKEAGEYRDIILHIITLNRDEVFNWDHPGFQKVLKSFFA